MKYGTSPSGADVSALTLARCYWQLAGDVLKDEATGRRGDEAAASSSNSPRLPVAPSPRQSLSAAAREFQRELDRVKAQPVPQEPKAKQTSESEELYLRLCLNAVKEGMEKPGEKK